MCSGVSKLERGLKMKCGDQALGLEVETTESTLCSRPASTKSLVVWPQSKSLYTSGPQFPYLQNGDYNTSLTQGTESQLREKVKKSSIC